MAEDANTERLHQYWVHGEGAAKIRWGEPGDFQRCVDHLGKFIRNPQGYCDLAHHAALGMWPAQHAKLLHGRSAPSVLPVLEVPGQGLRFNPFHAPAGAGGGRFTSAASGSGGGPAKSPAKGGGGSHGSPASGTRRPAGGHAQHSGHRQRLLARAHADREKARQLERELHALEQQLKSHAQAAAAAGKGGSTGHISTHKKTTGTHKHAATHHHSRHRKSLQDRVAALREQIKSLRDSATALEAQAKGQRSATSVTPVTFATLGLPLTTRDAEGSAGMALDTRAVMPAAGQNDLPDDAFAFIEPGGTKDSGGKTVPRSKRHFPVHDAAHTRNALARAPQSPFGDRAMPKIKAAAKKFGIQVAGEDSGGRAMTGEYPELRITDQLVELRDFGGDGQWIGGYASVFMPRVSRNLGGFVERVAPTAFSESRASGWPDVVCRYNHDSNLVLGTSHAGTLQLQADGVGLDYRVLPPESRADIRELVQRGDIRYSSFAFRVRPGGDEWGITDQNFPMRTLHDVELVDVAPVLTPAYPDATAAVRATNAALRSLADHMQIAVDEVRSLAEADELRKLFTRSDKPVYRPEPKRLFGPAAAMMLLSRKCDPYDSQV